MNKYFTILIASILIMPYSQGKVTEVKNQQELSKILKANNFVVLKFKADWCPICKKVEEPFNEIAKNKNFKDIKFVIIDFDTAPKLVRKYQIRGIPHIKYIKKTKIVGEKIGVKGKKAFIKNLKKDISKHFGK